MLSTLVSTSSENFNEIRGVVVRYLRCLHPAMLKLFPNDEDVFQEHNTPSYRSLLLPEQLDERSYLVRIMFIP